MTIGQKDKNQLIKYRIDQANETIEVVGLLIENDRLPAAANRIYYGIFYALLALALKYDFETSKHLQLIGWFNKEFVKTNKIEVRYGKILRIAYENRTSGDYDAFYEFDKKDILELYEDMKDFIKHIEGYLNLPRI